MRAFSVVNCGRCLLFNSAMRTLILWLSSQVASGSFRRPWNSIVEHMVGAALQNKNLGSSIKASAREILSEARDDNPLGDEEEDPPPISLLIVAARKDFNVLPYSLQFARHFSQNLVNSVTIVVPKDDLQHLPPLDPSVQIQHDESVLTKEMISTIKNHHHPGRYGWVLQQVITFHVVSNSSASGVLVMDADTLLTGHRTFLTNSGRQVLFISKEYHQEYETHAERIWGRRRSFQGLSFVSHHQLMQPSLVREMFPSERALIEWVERADTAQKSALSEYHCYGRWVSDHRPHKVEIASWKNKSIPRNRLSDVRELVREENPGHYPYFSVSLHHYVQ